MTVLVWGKTMSRRPKRYPIPPVHFLMFLITFILTILCLILYHFSPENKAQLYAGVVTTLIGIIVGKASNQFGKSMEQLTEEANKEADAMERAVGRRDEAA